MDYKNKSILITGASSGIGEALAYNFINKGARVIISGRNLNELTRVKNTCTQPKNVEILVMDIANYHSTAHVIQNFLGTNRSRRADRDARCRRGRGRRAIAPSASARLGRDRRLRRQRADWRCHHDSRERRRRARRLLGCRMHRRCPRRHSCHAPPGRCQAGKRSVRRRR